MADPDRALAAAAPALELLFLAPLPFLRDGTRAHQLGVSVFYAELLPRLAALGHRVRVFAEAPPAVEGEVRAPLPIACEGLAIEPLAFDYRSGRTPADRAFCTRTGSAVEARFGAMVAEARPDLVLLGREILAPALLPLCRAHGLRAAVIAHGVTLAAAEAAHYPEAARDALYGALRDADAVIAVARHLEASLRALGVERARTIPNGADTRRFHTEVDTARLRGAWKIPPDRLVVAQVASLKPPKRPRALLEAARLLRDEALPVVYVIVGDGPERASLEAFAHEEGLTSQVRFPGEIDHAHMPEVMRLADLVVLASEREGLPLVYGETQASGRVVVASDIPAAREAIAHGQTGWLFPTGDIGALAEALRSLLSDAALRRRIGHASREAAESWNAESVARAYAAAFAQIVQGAATAHRSP